MTDTIGKLILICSGFAVGVFIVAPLLTLANETTGCTLEGQWHHNFSHTVRIEYRELGATGPDHLTDTRILDGAGMCHYNIAPNGEFIVDDGVMEFSEITWCAFGIDMPPQTRQEAADINTDSVIAKAWNEANIDAIVAGELDLDMRAYGQWWEYAGDLTVTNCRIYGTAGLLNKPRFVTLWGVMVEGSKSAKLQISATHKGLRSRVLGHLTKHP